MFVPPSWEYRRFVSLPTRFYLKPQANERLVDVMGVKGGPYFQSMRCIERVRNHLPEWFAPSELGRERLRALYGDLLDRMDAGEHFTALHVRRGDYVQHSDRFPLLTPAYYRKALETIRSENPDTQALVFSDDIPFCRQNADEYGFTGAMFVEGHVRPIPVHERTSDPLDILDLWLMARCHDHVIANSSFSWWGAFLAGDDQAVYPDRWFGDPALADTMWNCIPEGWRQVPC